MYKQFTIQNNTIWYNILDDLTNITTPNIDL